MKNVAIMSAIVYHIALAFNNGDALTPTTQGAFDVVCPTLKDTSASKFNAYTKSVKTLRDDIIKCAKTSDTDNGAKARDLVVTSIKELTDIELDVNLFDVDFVAAKAVNNINNYSTGSIAIFRREYEMLIFKVLTEWSDGMDEKTRDYLKKRSELISLRKGIVNRKNKIVEMAALLDALKKGTGKYKQVENTLAQLKKANFDADKLVDGKTKALDDALTELKKSIDSEKKTVSDEIFTDGNIFTNGENARKWVAKCLDKAEKKTAKAQPEKKTAKAQPEKKTA